MKVILIYIIGGIVINFGSIFIVWGYYSKICRGDSKLYYDVMYRNFTKGIKLPGQFDGVLRIIVTQLLWPLNVYNTLVIGISSIREVRRMRKK